MNVRFGLVVLIACACACSKGAEDATTPTTPPKPAAGDAAMSQKPATSAKVYVESPSGEVTVDVEVVATEATVERGLMYREHLPLDSGMLFLMDAVNKTGLEKDWSFWMRNTLIPLDMLFIKKNMTVAGIVENAEPKTETLRQVGVPSFYVLEVNGGWAKHHNVTAGAKVRFENIPQ